MEQNIRINETPWNTLKQLIKDENIQAVKDFTDSLSRDELLHALFILSQSEQKL